MASTHSLATPGPHDLAEPVDVHGVHREGALDLGAHGGRPGLGAEDADAQRRGRGVEPLRAVLIEDREHVGGRDHDRGGAEVLDQAHLARRHPPRGRHHGAAQPLGAVMRAEPAGEEPVAVGDVHHVAGPGARGAHGAGHDLGPGGEVALGVAHDGGLAGGARGGVDAAHPLARDGEHPKGVARAQVRLGGEREAREVGQVSQVAWVDAGGVERLAVVGDVVAGVRERPAQAAELERVDLVARGDLDRVQILAPGGQVVHGALSSGRAGATSVREGRTGRPQASAPSRRSADAPSSPRGLRPPSSNRRACATSVAGRAPPDPGEAQPGPCSSATLPKRRRPEAARPRAAPAVRAGGPVRAGAPARAAVAVAVADHAASSSIATPWPTPTHIVHTARR